MKGAEELLKPVVDKPQGLPPKKLIVWVFALLMTLIVFFAGITTTREPALKTSDEYAREVASKLNGSDKELLDKGSTWVDDAYSASGLAAQIAQGLVNPVSAGAPPNALAGRGSALSSVAASSTSTSTPASASLSKPPTLGNPAASSAALAGPLPLAASLSPGLPMSALPSLPALGSWPASPAFSQAPGASGGSVDSGGLGNLGGSGAFASKRSPSGGPALSSVDVAQEVEAINSKMMVADFDDHNNMANVASSLMAPSLDLKKPKSTNLTALSHASRGVELKGQTVEFNAPSSPAINPGSADLRALSSGSALVSNSALGKDMGDEDWLRQALKGEEEKTSPATVRSKDGLFLKEFKADVPVKPGLRSSPLESTYSVLEGSVIPAVLGRDVNSDLPGVITATVTQTVYDSVHSRKPLICKGAKLIGRYSNEIRGGQSRLLFAFARLILSDGRSFNLPGFDGSDAMGGAGARADVDNHFFKLYGSSLAIGVLTDQVSKQNLSTQGVYAQPSATGQILVQTTKEILQRNQDVAPTLTVANGTRINVEVRRDLVFPERGLPSCG